MSSTFLKPSMAARARVSPALASAVLATLSIAAFTISPATAQVQAGPDLYKGDAVQLSGVKLASWGSGTVEEATSPIYTGASASLRISTQGLYQGASITLPKPVDIGSFVAIKDAYLQIAVIPPVINTNGPGGSPGSGGFPGSSGGFPGSGGPPPGDGAGSGGAPGSGGPTSGGSGGAGGPRARVTFLKPHAMTSLRVVLVTSTNHQVELLLPLSSSHEEGQWKVVTIPLAAIPDLKADDARIKQVRVFGDASGTMRLGKIGVIIDSTPITISPLDSKVAQGRVLYRYTASAIGGNTPLRISWDWDASDGIQDESQGRSAQHAYRKEGEYIVTVTASDYYGIKKPAVATFKVHVTP